MGIAEIIAAIISLGVVGTPITWLWLRQNTMNAALQNTYSKNETHDLIDLKQRPLQESLDRNTRVCEKLADVLDELRIEMAEARGYDKGKSGSG